jgi:hypothetical protein
VSAAATLGTRLDSLYGALERLLAALEQPKLAEPAALDEGWCCVQRGFDELRSALADASAPSAESSERLDGCRRLYAVALGLAAQQREVLAGERTRLADARARLRRARTAGDNGASCDVRA